MLPLRSMSSHLFVLKHLPKAKSKGVEMVTLYPYQWIDRKHQQLICIFDHY
jgi:hypothetical protein